MFKRSKLMFGIIMGAVLGLAFAPKKGKELREEIKSDLKKGGNASNILKKNATHMGQDMIETAKEIYETPEVQKHLSKGKKEAGKILHNVKEELVKKGEELGELAKEKFVETKNKIAEDLGMENETTESTPKKSKSSSRKKKKS